MIDLACNLSLNLLKRKDNKINRIRIKLEKAKDTQAVLGAIYSTLYSIQRMEKKL